MTFDEAINRIIEKCSLTFFEGKALYDRKLSPVEAIKIIEDLQEAYMKEAEDDKY